jgi:hypothetical protein
MRGGRERRPRKGLLMVRMLQSAGAKRTFEYGGGGGKKWVPPPMPDGLKV